MCAPHETKNGVLVGGGVFICFQQVRESEIGSHIFVAWQQLQRSLVEQDRFADLVILEIRIGQIVIYVAIP